MNVPVPRSGALTLALTDIRPATTFAAVSTAAACWADATGRPIVRLGYGTAWSLPVEEGEYCITLTKADRTADDVWFTLTATRP